MENIENEKYLYIVNLDIIIEKTGKSFGPDYLCICDTVEKCREFTENHIQMAQNANAKNGVTWEIPVVTDADAIIKWTDKNGSWYYWYTFIPVKKYD